jgi:hypothetical protein
MGVTDNGGANSMFTALNVILVVSAILIFWGLRMLAAAVRRVADVLYEASKDHRY